MSYCRWSSDNYQCDVYVYEDVNGGWTTHVATGRHELPDPLIPYPDLTVLVGQDDTDIDYTALADQMNAYQAQWATTPIQPIGLAYDGQTFNDPTPGDCADRLTALATRGYNVPTNVIDTLRDEHRTYLQT